MHIAGVQISKNNRVIESDDDEDSDSAPPPAKKHKSDSLGNVLCKDFMEEPTDLIDNYLDTLVSMYPSYDKMVDYFLVYSL